MATGRRHVVPVSDADSGTLHGGEGRFRILLDAESVGARQHALLLNSADAGSRGAEHSHEGVEQSWYVLSGAGTLYVEGVPYRLERGTAAYVPPDTRHRIDVDPGVDLEYLVVYAPPGPEQLLRESGAHAFDDARGPG